MTKAVSVESAFTLVELLVVIGIIALIASIAIPVFILAKGKVRQSSCSSNLHQLGLASLLYAEDWDGYFPLYINVSQGVYCREKGFASQPQSCSPSLLHQVLSPYVKSSTIWFCPSDQFAGMNVNVWYINHLYSSYAFNFGKGTVLTTDGLLIPGDYISPSMTEICEDGNDFNEDEDAREGWPIDGDGHFNGDNTFFLDGHVKWFPIRWSH